MSAERVWDNQQWNWLWGGSHGLEERKERPCIRSAVSQTIVKATTEIWSRSAVGHKQQTTSLFPLPRDLHHPYVSLPNISRYVWRLWLAANVSLSANNLNNQPGWISTFSTLVLSKKHHNHNVLLWLSLSSTDFLCFTNIINMNYKLGNFVFITILFFLVNLF